MQFKQVCRLSMNDKCELDVWVMILWRRTKKQNKNKNIYNICNSKRARQLTEGLSQIQFFGISMLQCELPGNLRSLTKYDLWIVFKFCCLNELRYYCSIRAIYLLLTFQNNGRVSHHQSVGGPHLWCIYHFICLDLSINHILSSSSAAIFIVYLMQTV